jgi:putative transposase
MKKSRFTESQIVSVLKEGEAGVSPAELARRHGISRATYYSDGSEIVADGRLRAQLGPRSNPSRCRWRPMYGAR